MTRSAFCCLRNPRFDQWRLQALISLMLDTGVRIEEALTLRIGDMDLDNLLLTVYGKGRKERRVPFSFELRKVLFRYGQIRAKACPQSDLLFPSRRQTRWDQRNSLRGLHLRQDKLGLPRFGWHRLRHTFAINYLRSGGEVVRLSRVLGHSQISTTMRYVHLMTEDLQARGNVWADRDRVQRKSLFRGVRCERLHGCGACRNRRLLGGLVVAGHSKRVRSSS